MKTITNTTHAACALIVFGCSALVPQARATCQDACLTNNNTVLGDNALLNNTSSGDTALGAFTLFSNTTGSNNTASGGNALYNNTIGFDNIANGVYALFRNESGDGNTATGFKALAGNTQGSENVAFGEQALLNDTVGNYNTAVGGLSLYSNIQGTSNTAIGFEALYNTIGSFNIAVGNGAGFLLTFGNLNIDIGNEGVRGESNTIRIGGSSHTATFIGGIRDVTTANGDAIPVVIDSAGQLGTMSSSERFKGDIQPMDKTSEAILTLRPVTFHYKSDNAKRPQFGLVAEEVAKVNPSLVVRDKSGDIYTVRYDAVNAMLLNEFLKEHRKVQELEANAAKQQSNFAEQQKQIEALTAQIQKVSAQLELSKPAPQTVSR